MANLAITTANIRYPNDPKVVVGKVGAAVDAGDIVRLASDGRWVKARGNNAANSAGQLGWVMGDRHAADEDAMILLEAQSFTPGISSMSRDTIYVLSSTSTTGKIAPITDLSGTQPVVALLFALSATTARFMPTRLGTHF